MQIGLDSSGTRLPLWLDSLPRPAFPSLDRDMATDICIIGAGISGLSTAYHLLKAGRQVIVIEDGRVGSGETGRTTAHLSNALDDRYCEIEKVHGLTGTKLAAASHTAAIDSIETIINNESIDCDFMRLDGYLFKGMTDHSDILKRELDAAHRAGLTHVQALETAPAQTFAMGSCLLFPHQGQFHPLKYLTQLAQVIQKMGGRIFEQTRALGFEPVSQIVVSTSTGRKVTAKGLVIAANAPLFSKMVMHTKQEAARTYVIGARIPRDSLKSALYWDTLDPYHYIRLQKGQAHQDFDTLIIGGEDHRTGLPHQATAAFVKLEAWARDYFPQLQEVTYRWSGQVLEPVDYMGFIGRYPTMGDNVYLVTGDSGNGMTHGALAGLLLTDLIMERDNPWAELYDPARQCRSLHTLTDFASHNLQAMAGYAAYLTPGELGTVEDIPIGKGAIIRHGLHKIAIYRDEHNRLHQCSAVCPHAQALLNWNSTEKTWDCPAHGSRFSIDGDVLNGPAHSTLSRLSQQSK